MAGAESAYVLLQGGQGTGKSICIAAADAALSDAQVDHVVLDPRQAAMVSHLFTTIGRTGKGPVVLVDDCDRFASTLSTLFEKRSSLAGLIATTAEVGSGITQQLTGLADSYIRLPHIQQRPAALLLMASLMWQDLVGSDSHISEACDDSAVAALIRGPLPEGAWSLNEVLRLLMDQLVSAGDLAEGRINRNITGADISSAILEHAASRFSPVLPEPRPMQVVLEGDTDVIYTRRAADLVKIARDWDLLSGLELQAAASGRGGGAEAVTARLLGLRESGITAVGIYDNDAPGRRAVKLARERGLHWLLLPENLDPLRRRGDQLAVEIEDLLPVDLLMRFYEQHSDLLPEERHWRNGYWRIVPSGRDKDTLARWVCDAATTEDMDAFVYLLCAVRSQVGLPVPSEAMSLRDLERSIRARQVEDQTVGLPFRVRLDEDEPQTASTS
jgi:hypothetical protein